jgi:hypothetical protein
MMPGELRLLIVGERMWWDGRMEEVLAQHAAPGPGGLHRPAGAGGPALALGGAHGCWPS